jgi:Tat protein secretion system quality control protein TatD with DNase activity
MSMNILHCLQQAQASCQQLYCYKVVIGVALLTCAAWHAEVIHVAHIVTVDALLAESIQTKPES